MGERERIQIGSKENLFYYLMSSRARFESLQDPLLFLFFFLFFCICSSSIVDRICGDQQEAAPPHPQAHSPCTTQRARTIILESGGGIKRIKQCRMRALIRAVLSGVEEDEPPFSWLEEAELLAVWGSGSHPVALPVFVN